jgi:hypothetical protein
MRRMRAGSVAENRAVCRVPGVSAKIASRSSAKPMSSISSASSRTSRRSAVENERLAPQVVERAAGVATTTSARLSARASAGPSTRRRTTGRRSDWCREPYLWMASQTCMASSRVGTSTIPRDLPGHSGGQARAFFRPASRGRSSWMPAARRETLDPRACSAGGTSPRGPRARAPRSNCWNHRQCKGRRPCRSRWRLAPPGREPVNRARDCFSLDGRRLFVAEGREGGDQARSESRARRNPSLWTLPCGEEAIPPF